jgi:chromosome segregation ATPase
MIPDTLLTVGAGGIGFGAGVWIAKLTGQGIAWVVNTFIGRFDKREADLDAGVKELIDQLREQVKELKDECAGLKTEVESFRKRLNTAEAELIECLKKHAESDARVLHLEAAQAGLGDAKAHAALIVAAEKVDAKINKDAKT